MKKTVLQKNLEKDLKETRASHLKALEYAHSLREELFKNKKELDILKEELSEEKRKVSVLIWGIGKIQGKEAITIQKD